LKEQFHSDASLIVDWDGKLLPDLTGNGKVDRLPFITSDNRMGVNQLLGFVKLYKGTGESQASPVAKLVRQWGLADRVNGMCFNTTDSNTGSRNGACVLLEHKLEKEMLHLAYRHHMMESILALVFTEARFI